MRVVIQRVSQAQVDIAGTTVGAIKRGLMVLVGFEAADTAEDITWMVGKIHRLRIFADEKGLMNLSVSDVKGEVLVVSQFTLFASYQKGNRPSYLTAAVPAVAMPLYDAFVQQLKTESGRPIATGRFGADMQVSLVNDGPITICMDSKRPE